MRNSSCLNKLCIKFFLSLSSVFIALLIIEFFARIVFDPIDYLKPRRVYDEILGFRIQPGTGAHDKWGFRNKIVPQKANYITIGDSHTYGISAKASDSWPSYIERISGKVTYNLSLPGYGPVEYYYLLENNVFELNPDTVFVGLYLGNDLLNAFDSVYSNEHWAFLRNKNIQTKKINRKKNKYEDTFFHRLRHFLPGNSVIYRLISSSVMGDQLRQLRRLYKGQDIIMYENSIFNIDTGFLPEVRLKALDLSDLEVSEGLRITIELINKMNSLCNQENIELIVVIIPTKESVYSEFIENNYSLPDSDLINDVIKNEREINKLIKSDLNRYRIKYVDVLPFLMAKTHSEQLYPENFGGHVNKNGYKIIATSVLNYVR